MHALQDNVEALARLAHKYDVAYVIDACTAAIKDMTFTMDAAIDGVQPWDQPMHVLHWLQLGSQWDMDEVVSKCLDMISAEKIVCYRTPSGASVNCSKWGVHSGVYPYLMDEQYLCTLSPTTVRQVLRKLVGPLYV